MDDKSNNEVWCGTLNATNINNDNQAICLTLIKVKIFISGTHKHGEQ